MKYIYNDFQRDTIRTFCNCGGDDHYIDFFIDENSITIDFYEEEYSKFFNKLKHKKHVRKIVKNNDFYEKIILSDLQISELIQSLYERFSWLNNHAIQLIKPLKILDDEAIFYRKNGLILYKNRVDVSIVGSKNGLETEVGYDLQNNTDIKLTIKDKLYIISKCSIEIIGKEEIIGFIKALLSISNVEWYEDYCNRSVIKNK